MGSSQGGTVRIIGGHWRSRKLSVAEVPGLRPTADRVRETVFNWLAPLIVGARCIDLFAGTGAMGLEALSRGAARVEFVENDPRAVAALRKNLDALGPAPGGEVQLHPQEALRYLERPSGETFDIVFLDPPFGKGLLETSLASLVRSGRLAEGARIYAEFERGLEPVPPEGWQWLRRNRAGQVEFGLLIALP